MTTTEKSAPVAPLGKVKTAPVAAVKPYEGNPRRIPTKAIEQTAKSIREFGWQQPIVVDQDFVIVAGHTRHAAAKLLGLSEVPIIVAEHLDAQQLRAFRVADNRAHDYSAWDYTALVEELAGLGEDFADVLDLADWSSLMSAFETAQETGDTGEGVRGSYELPEEADGVPLVGSGAFTVRVEFATKDDAERAGPALMKVPGVLNVRHPIA